MNVNNVHILSKMFDVGDLPVLTFGNCVLKTGVIKWPLKLYERFFSKPSKHNFLRFLVVARVSSNTARHRHIHRHHATGDICRKRPHLWPFALHVGNVAQNTSIHRTFTAFSYVRRTTRRHKFDKTTSPLRTYHSIVFAR